MYNSTEASNYRRLQPLLSKTLRKITEAPFYVSNLTVHNDLQVPVVQKYLLYVTITSIHIYPTITTQENSSLSEESQVILLDDWGDSGIYVKL